MALQFTNRTFWTYANPYYSFIFCIQTMLHPYCMTGKTPQQRQQQLSNTSVAAPKGTLTSLAGGGSTSNTSTTGITGTTNGNNSSANVGHPNKSKVMHDLFGIETTDSPKTTSSSSHLVASTSRYDYYCNNFWLVTTLDCLINKDHCCFTSHILHPSTHFFM